MKIHYKVQSLFLLIGVSHTTQNYSINEEKFTTLLEITRVPSYFLLPYPTLLGFEKPLLVIACPKRAILGDQGQKTARRTAERAPT